MTAATLADRLAAAEAELSEIAAEASTAYRTWYELDHAPTIGAEGVRRATVAYRVWDELNRKHDAKADEIRDLRRQAREEAASSKENDR